MKKTSNPQPPMSKLIVHFEALSLEAHRQYEKAKAERSIYTAPFDYYYWKGKAEALDDLESFIHP